MIILLPNGHYRLIYYEHFTAEWSFALSHQCHKNVQNGHFTYFSLWIKSMTPCFTKNDILLQDIIMTLALPNDKRNEKYFKVFSTKGSSNHHGISEEHRSAVYLPISDQILLP